MAKRVSQTKKLLDRYVGIPLIYILSFFKRKRAYPKQIKTIGILKLAAIGDTILLAHQIQQLHSHGYKIIFFCSESLKETGELLYVDTIEVVSLKAPWKAFRKHSLDILFDCEPWARISALLTLFAQTNFTVGFSTSHQYKHRIFDHAIFHNSKQHEINNYKNLFSPLTSNRSVENPLKKIRGKPSRYIVLHACSFGNKGHLKMWPRSSWIRLIRELSDYTIYLTGSKNDTSLLQELAPAISKAGVSISETANILANAKLVITIDTGIMHLAAALGVPTIVLHGPTSPHRWGGIGSHVYPLQQSVEYTPCLSLGHESTCSNNICMQKITVEQVLACIDENELLTDNATHEKATHPLHLLNTSL